MSTASRQRYEELLRLHVPGLGGDVHIRRDAELLDLGLDSLRTMRLLVAIEEAFGVSFPDELLVKRTFQTAESLWNALVSSADTGSAVEPGAGARA